MRITESQVEHIAKLARLHLTADELHLYQKNMEKVLDYVQQLESLDTDDIEPAYHAIQLQDHFRQDQVEEGLTQEQTFANAASQTASFFQVPQILSGDNR